MRANEINRTLRRYDELFGAKGIASSIRNYNETFGAQGIASSLRNYDELFGAKGIAASIRNYNETFGAQGIASSLRNYDELFGAKGMAASIRNYNETFGAQGIASSLRTYDELFGRNRLMDISNQLRNYSELTPSTLYDGVQWTVVLAPPTETGEGSASTQEWAAWLSSLSPAAVLALVNALLGLLQTMLLAVEMHTRGEIPDGLQWAIAYVCELIACYVAVLQAKRE
jgi:hypothetical protein